jgi:hypothetical protein
MSTLKVICELEAWAVIIPDAQSIPPTTRPQVERINIFIFFF